VYTADRSLDESIATRDGDLVLVPRGYHTVSAAPGYDAYYLNVMAGPGQERAWKIVFDPHQDWLRDTWEHQDVDPRLPLHTRGA
jgi:5-deoxy-glucuronate isomerase